MVKENCGVVGVFSNGDTNVIPMVLDALRALQHRGQEGEALAIIPRPGGESDLISRSSLDSSWAACYMPRPSASRDPMGSAFGATGPALEGSADAGWRATRQPLGNHHGSHRKN